MKSDSSVTEKGIVRRIYWRREEDFAGGAGEGDLAMSQMAVGFSARNKSGDRMPNRRARVLQSKIIYEGHVFSVRQDRIVEPGGIRATRDLVVHNGSVVLLPIFPGGSILMVRQYRHALGTSLWELVAGRVEPGESRPAAARRELIEETGYTASRVKQILEIFPSPGFVTERMWIFAATGLRRGVAQPEEDERITARKFSLAALEKMIRGGSLHDAKSVAAILFYARFLK